MKPTTIVLALLIGALLGIVVGPSEASAPAPQDFSVGRFQLVFNPDMRADTFLLDTAEGRIWRQTEVTDVEGNPVIWNFEERLDSQEEVQRWLKSKVAK